VEEAAQRRARVEAGAARTSTRAALRGLLRERRKIRAALNEISTSVEPAGQAAVDAAVAMQKAGKGEMLRILTARRDLNLLRTRRLEILRRDWAIVGQMVALTGELP
jgi:outer membrane protein, heavy metal efflux system